MLRTAVLRWANTSTGIYSYTSTISSLVALTTSATIANQPDRDAFLKCTLTSLVGGVTISIYGSLDSSSVLDTITVAPSISEAYRISSEAYDTVTAITASGFTSGNLLIEAVEPDGQPIEAWSLSETIKVRMSKKTVAIGAGIPGMVEVSGFRAYTLDDVDEDYRMVIAGQTYRIESKLPFYDPLGLIAYYAYDIEHAEGQV